MGKDKYGHIAALATILMWGLTFISSKILLVEFKPAELLLLRFVIGFLVLSIISPHRIKFGPWKTELLFAGAGLSGMCLYYMLENIALTYTMASNVGIITATAAFFSALMVQVVSPEKDEKLGVSFFIGFVISMLGIGLISFNGASLEFNPLGDLLALIASFMWGIYSVFIKKINAMGYKPVEMTKHTFVYGILFMIPFVAFSGLETGDFSRYTDSTNILNLLFLGIGASGFCFLLWNYAVSSIGAVRTSVYIYLNPVVTVLFSVPILGEPITLMSGAGIILTLGGLVLSQHTKR